MVRTGKARVQAERACFRATQAVLGCHDTRLRRSLIQITTI